MEPGLSGPGPLFCEKTMNNETVETVRIVAASPEQGKFIIINASDFDADKHVLFDDSDDDGNDDGDAAASTKRGRKARPTDAAA